MQAAVPDGAADMTKLAFISLVANALTALSQNDFPVPASPDMLSNS